jgi:hypothetical protein
MAGVAGLIWWGFVQPAPQGSSFSVGLSLGAMAVQYDPTPFWLPLYLVLAGLLLITQSLVGSPAAYLGGVLLGLALPYLVFRLRGGKP